MSSTSRRPATAPLDEVRADVVKAWTDAETEKRVSDLAAKLFDRLKGGASLADLATEIGKHGADG